jgi:Flp pilus assembly pilin Flp
MEDIKENHTIIAYLVTLVTAILKLFTGLAADGTPFID